MIETLNRDCFCISLDRDALRRALEADPAARGGFAPVLTTAGAPAAAERTLAPPTARESPVAA